MDIQKFIGY